MIWSLIMRPPGMKKLVPTVRSRISSSPAASSTANPSSARTAVTSHAQQVSGIRISRMPWQRRSTVVAMKLMAPISEAPQKIAMLEIHKVWPRPSPGPVMRPAALSGGYAVQPDSGAPPCTKNADTMTTRARNVGQHEEHHDGAVHGHQRQVQLGRHHAARRRRGPEVREPGHFGLRVDHVEAHQQRQRHPQQYREQPEKVILNSDHFVIQAENVLSDEALRRLVRQMGGGRHDLSSGLSSGTHFCAFSIFHCSKSAGLITCMVVRIWKWPNPQSSEHGTS